MATHLGVADRLVPLLERVVGDSLPIRVRGWDGSESGPTGASTILVRSPRALRRLLWQPNELGLGRAYVAGELDVEGDLYEVLRFLAPLLGKTDGRHALSAADRGELIKTAVVLGAVGPQPKPPPEEAALSGRRHSRSRDRAAVRHHYDVGNDFYRIVLGPSLVYSCAYWTAPDDPTYTLEDAQRDKLDLICRKLELRPGMRLLDVGCGWGSLVIHAAREYGVSAVGVTLSGEQAALARARAAEAGLSKQVEIRVEDYRDVPDGPYDAIASIGMAEHVGLSQLGEYADRLHSLLSPGGRVLNHAISRRPGPPGDPHGDKTSFIDRYVFPDGELQPLSTIVEVLEAAGLEVRDVESLREHYADTLRAWVANLEQNWDKAVQLSSAGRVRVWRLYMAGSALGFQSNRLGVNQVLAVRPGPGGASGLPRTRSGLLAVP
jgi:cyclopropane-fatty-acyl-phospholipid synthase